MRGSVLPVRSAAARYLYNAAWWLRCYAVKASVPGQCQSRGVVDFRCVPFAEAVGTDALIPQVIEHDPQLLLNCSFCDGEHQLCAPDTVPQTAIFNILVYHHVFMLDCRIQLPLLSQSWNQL